MSDIAVKIENLKKEYRLGVISNSTLNAEIQSWWARVRKKEDPNMKLGQASDGRKIIHALDGLNLEIKKGEAIGIIGSNGAGKSTLLKILARVTAPTEGDIWINGRISSMLEVGTGFHGELTGRENIYMNGAILGMSKKEVDAKIESIIDFSECRDFIDTPVKRYSSGMYVKLAFAVAAHLDSEILIMDEVLAVGDVQFQKKCLGKMGDVAINDQKTIFYVSHNMATIRNLCTRCSVLQKGRVVYDGDVENAISIYMDIGDDSLHNHYDFRGKTRPAFDWGQRMELLNLSFDDRELPIYNSNERMRLKLCWLGKDTIRDVRVRMNIQYADGSVVGMAESGVIAQVEKDVEETAVIEFDLHNLAEGDYSFQLSFFILKANGTHTGYDGTPGRISFRVIDTSEDRTAWLRQYWSSIRFNDLKRIE